MLLSDVAAIAEGIAALIETDKQFAAILETYGPMGFTLKPGGFAGLLRIILGQQVSVSSAEALWRKLNEVVSPLDPQTLLVTNDDALRFAGLSRQKARYARALAEDVLSGRIAIEHIAAMDDEDAIARITSCIGLGRWTAENYLMFCEGRADMFPAKDLAILIGLQMLQGTAERPTPVEALAHAERWRPHRTAASLLIWHNYMGQIAARRRVK